MRSRRAAVALIVLALIGTACSKKTDSSKAEDKAKTYTVQVDAHKQGGSFGVYASRYFPQEVKAHPGDTLSFKLNWSGEPHSVTFGTLVDQGAAKFDPKAEDEPAEWQKIPAMLPDGPGDAVQSVVNPCFLATGAPPAAAACTKEQQTPPAAFDGKYTLWNSGFLADGATFTFKLAADVAAGTYSYFCALHRGAMAGKVDVVAASETVPSPADVLKAGDDAIAGITPRVQAAYDQSKNGKGPGTIFAGTTDPKLFEEELDAGVTEFLPKQTTAKVGAMVKFLPVGAHTVSFNPPQDAVELIVKAPDGSFHLNPKAGGPSQSPPTGPPAEDGKPVVTDAGTWNGEGFLNSGLLLGFGPPGAITWEVAFGKAGTYEYRCLVHPDMEGTITVS